MVQRTGIGGTENWNWRYRELELVVQRTGIGGTEDWNWRYRELELAVQRTGIGGTENWNFSGSLCSEEGGAHYAYGFLTF